MRKCGFTLVEVLVAVGILAAAFPALFAIVFGILRQQTKIYALKEIKRQGDLALNSMRVNIKNYAVGVYDGLPNPPVNEICSTAGSSAMPGTMYFLDTNGDYFGFRLQGTTINLNENSDVVQGGNLTTNTVRVTNFQMECNRTSALSPPIISLSYDIEYNTNSTRPEETARFTYQTKIKMKNY